MKRERYNAPAAFFNVPVEFLRRADIDDGLQKIPGPAVSLGCAWASRRDISDGEKYKAGELAADLSARFVVRYNAFTASITPKDMIDHNGELQIVGIKTLSEGNLIEFTTAQRSDK